MQKPVSEFGVQISGPGGISLDGGGPDCADFAVDGTGTVSFRVHIAP